MFYTSLQALNNLDNFPLLRFAKNIYVDNKKELNELTYITRANELDTSRADSFIPEAHVIEYMVKHNLDVKISPNREYRIKVKIKRE